MDNSNQEVVFERTYDVPAAKIWEAWTDPEQLKLWWGPDNVTIPECEVDLRVGGRFYIVMEADEGMGDLKGARWPMEAKYTKVDSPTNLSYEAKAWTQDEEEQTVINQTAELVLAETGGQTKMTLKVAVTSAGPRAGFAIQGMQYGYNQQFDKLAGFLAK